MKSSTNARSNEGPIASARRMARESNEECLASAEREAEQYINQLGRDPLIEERILIEHVAISDVRTRELRKSGKHKEADAATLVLSKLLCDLRKIRQTSRPTF